MQVWKEMAPFAQVELCGWGWVGVLVVGTGCAWKGGAGEGQNQVRSYCISFSGQLMNYDALIIPLKKFWLTQRQISDSAETSGVDFDLLSLNERIMPKGPKSLSCCILLKLTVSRYTS